MNIDNLDIEFDSTEGALRRILGVVESRGFDVRTMTMGSDVHRSNITLGLAPRDSGRCMKLLSRQLSRIYGVRDVSPHAPVVKEVEHVSKQH